MPSIVDSLNLISRTIDGVLDFVAQDETLSADFQEYLEINNIEIQSEREFNNIIIQYILDMKMQNGLKVLEYYRRNNHAYDEIINALENSVCAVFRVDKILSNAYNTTCLTSDTQMTLIPMVKMSNLKQIGRYDYIKARVIELSGSLYILEIYDVISEFNTYQATVCAIKYMLQNPRIAYYKNEEKKLELENCAKEFYEKFQSCFNCDYVTTTNKKVDKLIEFFNNYRLTGEKQDYSSLIEKVETNRFLKIDEFNCDDDTFMQNAAGGFSQHKETYDTALWIDKKRGLYIIPFLETFLLCFEKEIEGASDCIREFLTSDKVPPSVLKYAHEKYDNFFEVINKALKTNFQTLEEVLFNTKTAYIAQGVFSPVVVLFNSKLFSTVLGIEEKETINASRNELCPCGSGLKYKKCCGKN